MITFEEYLLYSYLERLLDRPLEEEEKVEYVDIEDLSHWENVDNELLCKRICGYC